MKYRDPSTGQFKSLTVKVSDTLPIGSMMPYGSLIAPEGWLICDGSAVSRTVYADLFAVIGTSYGDGDGSTTFNLPNKKGRNSVGLDSTDTDFNAIGKKGGEKTHTLTIDEMPSHYHQMSGVRQWNGTSGDHPWVASGDINSAREDGNTQSVGGGQAHNILQPYEVDNWIIKATQPIVAPGTVRNSYTNSDKDVYSCKYIEDEVNGTLFWTNPNPTSAFNPQTISEDLTNYDSIEIGYKDHKSAGIKFTKIKKYSTVDLVGFAYLSDSGGDNLCVRAVIVGDNSVQFNPGYALGVGTNSMAEQNNDCIIPCYIIGYNNSNLHDN